MVLFLQLPHTSCVVTKACYNYALHSGGHECHEGMLHWDGEGLEKHPLLLKYLSLYSTFSVDPPFINTKTVLFSLCTLRI